MLPPGLLSFPLTPFTVDDTVDLAVYADHLNAQIAAEPAALFVACGTGEFTALSHQEYRNVVRRAVKVAGGRLPVIAGAGGGPAMAREFVEAAADCGADGVLLLPPYLVEAPPTGVLRHVRYVAERARVPITVYQRANAVLNPATAVALLDVPQVVGIKDGVGDVSAMLGLVNAIRTSGHPRAEEFAFLNGLPTAEVYAQAYRAIGVDGYSSASLCFVPDIAAAFHRAYVAGDQHALQTLLSRFYLPFVALRAKVPGYAVSLVKAGAVLAGLPMGHVRPPLIDATAEHVEQLAALIDDGRAALAELSTVEAS